MPRALSDDRAGGKATPPSAPAQKRPVSILAKATLVVLVIFIALAIFAGNSGVPSGANATTTTSTTTQLVPETLFSQNSTIQLAEPSMQCAGYNCTRVWVEDFTVPAGIGGANLTGSYSSQYATAFAVLTSSQFANLSQSTGPLPPHTNTTSTTRSQASTCTFCPGAMSLASTIPAPRWTRSRRPSR